MFLRNAFSTRRQRQQTYLRRVSKERCLRIVRHVKGPLTGEPREIRLAPEQVRFAYGAAQELGYEPLSVAVEKIGSHAVHLLSGPAAPTPAWMREFLERLRDGLKEADPSILGMKRERLKREWRNVQPALTASVALAQGIAPAWERVVSERLYNDSKLLGRIRPHVVAILVRADPRWEGVPPEEAPELLEAYGVRRKPGLIRCAGAGTFRIGGRSYDLRDFQPVAHLPEAWAEAWVDAVEQAQVQVITTIENEYPFFSYVEESGGPDGLGKRSEVALYTAGFPTPGLMSALRLLCDRLPNLGFRHWGDADVGGLRIWWFLRSQLQRPIELFRTTAQWLDVEVQKGGTPLSSSERAALTRLQGQMEGISNGDVSAARDLIESLLHCGFKVEQERF
jgi:Wadjet anti plasmid transformation system JetA-like protein